MTIYGVFNQVRDAFIYALLDTSNWELLLGKKWVYGGVYCGCHAEKGQMCKFYVATTNVREYSAVTIPNFAF